MILGVVERGLIGVVKGIALFDELATGVIDVGGGGFVGRVGGAGERKQVTEGRIGAGDDAAKAGENRNRLQHAKLSKPNDLLAF